MYFEYFFVSGGQVWMILLPSWSDVEVLFSFSKAISCQQIKKHIRMQISGFYTGYRLGMWVVPIASRTLLSEQPWSPRVCPGRSSLAPHNFLLTWFPGAWSVQIFHSDWEETGSERPTEMELEAGSSSLNPQKLGSYCTLCYWYGAEQVEGLRSCWYV